MSSRRRLLGEVIVELSPRPGLAPGTRADARCLDSGRRASQTNSSTVARNRGGARARTAAGGRDGQGVFGVCHAPRRRAACSVSRGSDRDLEEGSPGSLKQVSRLPRPRPRDMRVALVTRAVSTSGRDWGCDRGPASAWRRDFVDAGIINQQKNQQILYFQRTQ